MQSSLSLWFLSHFGEGFTPETLYWILVYLRIPSWRCWMLSAFTGISSSQDSLTFFDYFCSLVEFGIYNPKYRWFSVRPAPELLWIHQLFCTERQGMVYFNNLLFAVLDSSFLREGFSAALRACSDEVTQITSVICTRPGKGAAVQCSINQLHGIHSTLAAWLPKNHIKLIVVIFFLKILFALSFFEVWRVFLSLPYPLYLFSHTMHTDLILHLSNKVLVHLLIN